MDGGWERVNTSVSPGGLADYTGGDEGGIEILWVRSSQLSERTASWSLELSPDLTAWQGSELAPISVIADGEETLVFSSSDSVTDVSYARLGVELE